MGERPIIMSAESVRAILDGRKTQTRRVVKGITNPEMADRFIAGIMDSTEVKFVHDLSPTAAMAVSDWLRCPYGQPGDRIWVREAFATHLMADDRVYAPGDGHPWGSPIYRASHGGMEPRCEGFTRWKSPLHMPRWASRLTLEITEVRVQRVQEITAADAEAEGAPPEADPFWGLWFASEWDHLNLKRGYSWDSNPWVWALTFTVVPAPGAEKGVG